MLIDKANLGKNTLSGKVVLITGAGGGIGFEAARALARLGARVIIAEIDNEKGIYAQNAINEELHNNLVCFYSIDITNQKQINELYIFSKQNYGFIDAIINNATITPMGAIDDVSIADWDKSYAVNLKAPIMLIQAFLPDMRAKNEGTIVFVPSSGAAPYMGAYEIFKTSQVELCNTLSGELENTNIKTYSIGPGLVKTETAQREIEKVASLMGMTIAEFYALNEDHILDSESAGVGFALSVVNAERYNGQEIGSIQALMDAGILSETKNAEESPFLSNSEQKQLSAHVKNIVNIYQEQYAGWLNRNIFERQWVLRDFKKTVGMTADNFAIQMTQVLELVEKGQGCKLSEYAIQFEKLKEYFIHQNKLLQGFEKDPEKLAKNSQILLDWINELQLILDFLFPKHV